MRSKALLSTSADSDLVLGAQIRAGYLRRRPSTSARRVPDQPTPMRHRGRLQPGGHAELGEDVRHVHAGGLARYEQLLGYLAVREPVGDQPEHLDLARGQTQPLELVRITAGAATSTSPPVSAMAQPSAAHQGVYLVVAAGPRPSGARAPKPHARRPRRHRVRRRPRAPPHVAGAHRPADAAHSWAGMPQPPSPRRRPPRGVAARACSAWTSARCPRSPAVRTGLRCESSQSAATRRSPTSVGCPPSRAASDSLGLDPRSQ